MTVELNTEEISSLSYDQAITEAEEILNRLENEKLPIDQVLEMSKRAAGLIKHCQSKIEEIGGEVDKILASLRSDTTSPSDVPF